MTQFSSLSLCMFGASVDTGNLGVSALAHAVLSGIAARAPANVTVFDHGWGLREANVPVDNGEFHYRLCGARLSQRVHRRESLWNMVVSNRLGGLGNPGLKAISAADAVIDVSGGDSFSDIYGRKRFRSIVIPKQLAIRSHTPLILLPQTYGPFRTTKAEALAASVVRAASMAWARDPASYDVLRELAGPTFDSARHRLGVDLAFSLSCRPTTRPLPARLEQWIADADDWLVGLNVSGLIYNSRDAKALFGLRLDYRRLIAAIATRLLEHPRVRLVLVPHVRDPSGVESDEMACLHVRANLPASLRDRVVIAPSDIGPEEAKWMISQLAWFCGTRMHATIAALSSRVPTCGIAYSMKISGVFASCGQGDEVADARSQDEPTVLTIIERSFEDRARIRASLEDHLPRVEQLAEAQMDEILAACRSARSEGRAAGSRS